MRNILVTGIGGVVGQGILRNINDMNLPIQLIGCNVVQVSAGNHLCSHVEEVPYAYDDAYIPAMLKICENWNIGLIIPSTDYEVYYLGLHQEKFNCAIAVSPHTVTAFCLDKYLNYQAFAKHNIPFAKSILPSEYAGEFTKCLVKPREGRGSRGIHINPSEPQTFDDKNLVQEYLEGDEVTTTFYVTKKNEIHGLITMVRELELGNTSKAQVVFDYDKEIHNIASKMIEHYPFRGSCNIQARVTSHGIIPFEINCRISGTNSVRSQFGFKDVAYTVQEYLLEEALEQPNVTEGTALRVILDVIYPEKSLENIKNRDDKFYIH